MTDVNTVLSWLEGLTQDDWRAYHSDSEVQNIAVAAMELIKMQNIAAAAMVLTKPKVMSPNDFGIEASENKQE